jgi:hypothetical protein
MIALIWLIYLIIILVYLIISGFIVYHLKRYSLNSPLNKILLPLFIAISILLVFSNFLLFSSVDWQRLASRLFY